MDIINELQYSQKIGMVKSLASKKSFYIFVFIAFLYLTSAISNIWLMIILVSLNALNYYKFEKTKAYKTEELFLYTILIRVKELCVTYK